MQSPRVRMINVRLTEQEYALLVQAAAGAGVPASRYVRDEALRSARGSAPD